MLIGDRSPTFSPTPEIKAIETLSRYEEFRFVLSKSLSSPQRKICPRNSMLSRKTEFLPCGSQIRGESGGC
jgi:hypothetical protein